jgi:hypothetical protein
MKLRLGRLALALMMAAVTPAALPQQGGGDETDQNNTRLPNGKLQRDEILKADYEQNLKDSARLADLAQQLQAELEKGDRFVLSLDTLKKTDEIEKLAKKIRSRLRHY